MIGFESVVNSLVDLEAVAIANDLMTIQAENERRYRAAAKAK